VNNTFLSGTAFHEKSTRKNTYPELFRSAECQRESDRCVSSDRSLAIKRWSGMGREEFRRLLYGEPAKS